MIKIAKQSLLALIAIFIFVLSLFPGKALAAPEDNVFEPSYWERYASRYYRSLMDDDGAALYDGMYRQCMDYLCSEKDIEYITVSGFDGYMMPYMDCGDLSWQEIREITRLFIDANPQFYFLKGSKLVEKKSKGKQYVTTDIYEEYIDGSSRKETTIQIMEKLEGWIKSLGGYATKYHTVKAIYNLVAENVSYDDSSTIHQSAAGAILDGVSVCAGYAELFEMLCCARGIDCIVVTGDVHEWNQVYIDEYWYNVDVTWDDIGDSAGKTYFALADERFVKLNPSHTPEDFYEKYRPKCEYNYNYKATVNKNTNTKTKTSYR